MKASRSIHSLLFASLLLSAFESKGVIYTSVPGVFSTGVDASGNSLSAGTADPHWSISASPAGSGSASVTDPYFMWIGNTPSSAWINGSGSSADSPPAGVYIYTLAFSLADFDPTTAQITGQWASDNVSTIYLNGIDTGFSNSNIAPWGFAHFSSFSLTNGFVAGENTLSFAVTQDPGATGNPTGLQVDILNAVAAVPEPGFFAFFGAACLSLMASASLKRRYSWSWRLTAKRHA